VAWMRPSFCRVAAARLDWYPWLQTRMMRTSRRVMAGVPPLGRGVAAPFQAVAGQHDGARDQAVFAPLVVAADIDEQGAAGLGAGCLGSRGAVRQRGPGLGEQLIDGLGDALSGHVGSPGRVVPSRSASQAAVSAYTSGSPGWRIPTLPSSAIHPPRWSTSCARRQPMDGSTQCHADAAGGFDSRPRPRAPSQASLRPSVGPVCHGRQPRPPVSGIG
jgi:hypothetical protein